MSSRKSKGKQMRRRTQRATSNVFAMFDKNQIQEFKEAFSMIDQNHDGYISIEDLREIFASLGKEPSDNELQNMLDETTGPINFTMFLTMFGERLNGTDPEQVIYNAYSCFDITDSGKISVDYIKEILMTTGDRMAEEDVDLVMHDAQIDNNGNFNYQKFAKVLRHGKQEPDLESNINTI
ncbi:hypothetical protein A3Q56_02927 [Intoshia linei]|uniref:EF-hand domain-containing protein n=1 Tax=Intoshia linei TaxID=1819745 RepID=A0A177B5F3_9BILA|nr:hypothetical protein A3Q56_02927 [Intoshia linei]